MTGESTQREAVVQRLDEATSSVGDMCRALTPDYFCPSVLEVDFNELAKRGVRHVVVDLDNTIRFKGEDTLRPEFVDCLVRPRLAGVVKTLSIATKNLVHNVPRITLPLRPDGIYRPYTEGLRFVSKSNPEFFTRISRDLDADPSSIVVISDEYLGDLLGAKRAEMMTVKVNPLGPDYLFDHLMRTRKKDDQALKGILWNTE